MKLTIALVLFLAACGGDDTQPVPDAPPAPMPDATVGMPDAIPGPDATPPPWPACTACACTSTGLLPLTELSTGMYMSEQGGLYPGGSNVRPAAHDATGLTLAQQIVPLDTTGAPDANGEYVLLSIGMSNTTQEFSEFVPLAEADPLRDPHLVVVDGAQGGQTANIWADPASGPWANVMTRLANNGVSPEQVVVAWVKVAHAAPMTAFPGDAVALRDDMVLIAQNLRQKFPNIAIAYYSSRIYAGYATGVSTLNPEPFAYQSGFAVKWLAQLQIDGDALLAPAVAPWIAWGPYLWADGTTPRAGDGLTWDCNELGGDGTHPNQAGRDKVAAELFDFVHEDTTAREWYLASP